MSGDETGAACNWTGAGDDIDDTAVPTNGGTDATIFNWVWGWNAESPLMPPQ